MSSFKCPVFRIADKEKHPNADLLSITHYLGWQVIIKTDSFQIGDLAVYIPVDAVLPESVWEECGLKPEKKVRAAKIRQVISEGMLMKLRPGCDWKEGDDVAELIGATKYEPVIPVNFRGGHAAPQNPFFPCYTDLENIKNYPGVLIEGEDVVITEKIHGTNFRAGYVKNNSADWGYEFVVGSRRMNLKEDADSVYWQAARRLNLPEILSKPENEGVVVYGEVFGWIQDLRYGHGPNEIDIRLFDASRNGTYMGYDEFVAFCAVNNLPTAPIIYRGPYHPNNKVLAKGDTEVNKGTERQMREGIVIKPTLERYDRSLGRVILKCISEEYSLRHLDKKYKNVEATEYH